jgi:hypothetical protein
MFRTVSPSLSQRRGTVRTLPHYLLFVLFCVLFVCKCELPPGDNSIAVNKYIIIRSLTLYIQHHTTQVLWLLASKQPQNLYDIYLMLYVQF